MTECIQPPWLCYEHDDKYLITDLVNFPVAEVPIFPNKKCSKQTARLITISPNMYGFFKSLIDDDHAILSPDHREMIERFVEAVESDD